MGLDIAVVQVDQEADARLVLSAAKALRGLFVSRHRSELLEAGLVV